MSFEDTISGQCEHGLDAGAYVLGALETDELDAFRAHLSRCEECRAEVAALQQVADELPAAAPPLTPPPDLRRRVMDAVRAEQRAEAAGAAERRRAPSRGRSRFGVPRLPALGGAIAVPRLPAFGGALVAAAAIAVAIVLATGGTSTRVIQASVSGAGTAKLIVTGGRGQLVVNHFPSPGSGRIYQVWLQRGKQAAPIPDGTHGRRTLFNVTSAGGGRVDVAGDLHGVSAVLVTSEPSGGSPHPTRSPVITANL